MLALMNFDYRGIVLFISMDLSLSSFVVATGFFALLESLLHLFLNYFGVSRQRFLLVTVMNSIGAVIGIFIVLGSGLASMIMPAVTGVMVPIYIGAWAILTGLCGFFHAAAMRTQTQGSWILVLSSLLALPGGVGLILQRCAGIPFSSVADRLIFNPLRCAACYRHVKSTKGMKPRTYQFREGISG